MWTDDLREILKRDGEDGFFSVRSYDEVDSTNEVLKNAAAAGEAEGRVVIAESQTRGKGRMGRNWVSPSGESIYMSLLLRPAFPAEKAPGLTLVMGLSAAQAVRRVCGLPVGIKWPNDIVIHGRKICGILTEAQIASGSRRSAQAQIAPAAGSVTEAQNTSGIGDPEQAQTAPAAGALPKAEYVIVGVGINVNNHSFAEEIRERATSLFIETGRDVSRAEIAASVLQHFHKNYKTYLETADFSGLIAEYDALLVSRDRQVRIEDPLHPHTGISRGITSSGALVVSLPDGTTEEVAYGEVSVRGMYGYV